jgi:uncharacterized protein YqeY
VVDVLQKMVKQRRESIAMYEQGGRPELAAAEAAEVAVIEASCPAALRGRGEGRHRGDQGRSGRPGIKDMGKVIAALKARHGAVLDMGKASGLVKAALA